MTQEDDTHGNLWAETVQNRVSYPVLETSVDTDVLVIGVGLTGARAALALADAGVGVVLLDSGTIAFGASGRSGGQCNPVMRDTPESLRKKLPADAADRLIAASVASGDDLFADIARYRVECDAVQKGWLQTAHTSKAAGNLERFGESWQREGTRLEMLDAGALSAVAGTRAYRFGLLHSSGGHVQPRSLTYGFAQAAAQRGARIFESTPAQSLRREGGKWIVTTPSGQVRAERVVAATNAYADNLVPGLASSILPLVSIILATEPLSRALRSTVLPAETSLSDTRRGIYYMRYDRDYRLVFGCIGSFDRVDLLGGKRRLTNGLATVFPQLAGIATPFVWSGRIAVTNDFLPHLHEPAPGLTIGLGFSGRGIAMTSVMGRNLARRVLGAPETDLDFPIVEISRFPFHSVLRALAPLSAPAASFGDYLDILFDRGVQR